MKVVAIIQARMGSTRLPGKVLRALGGQSVLAHVIERVRACPGIDEVIVATTRTEADDAIAREAAARGARVVRGSEDDVLARYYEAALQAHADVVIRITSDCPLLDPEVLDAMLRRFLAARASARRIDYLSNTLERTFPRGLDVEVLGFAALESAQLEAVEPHQREHVTPFIWERPKRFAVEQFTAQPDRSRLRWTLDTEDDWKFLSTVFDALGRVGTPPSTAQVLALLTAQPELERLNAHVEQKKLKA